MAIIWVGTGRFSAYIGPVQDYIDRVVAADVAAGNTLGLEVGVRDAYDVFIRDSINVGDLGTSGGVLSQANSIIKAAPIMAGARTLAGALVPLVGAAPTRFGTEGGWNYNRRTGTAGNGTDNYLNSNRNNNADPQNNRHACVYASLAALTSQLFLGGRSTVSFAGTSTLGFTGTAGRFRSLPSTDTFQDVGTASLNTPTLIGASRSSGSEYTARISGSNAITASASTTADNITNWVFALNNQGSPAAFSNARLAFYSIGESLNLALLDARVTALINAIAAAIP
jgi:hypothetical protein